MCCTWWLLCIHVHMYMCAAYPSALCMRVCCIWQVLCAHVHACCACMCAVCACAQCVHVFCASMCTMCACVLCMASTVCAHVHVCCGCMCAVSASVCPVPAHVACCALCMYVCYRHACCAPCVHVCGLQGGASATHVCAAHSVNVHTRAVHACMGWCICMGAVHSCGCSLHPCAYACTVHVCACSSHTRAHSSWGDAMGVPRAALRAGGGRVPAPALPARRHLHRQRLPLPARVQRPPLPAP